jgi:hypothetical protein
MTNSWMNADGEPIMDGAAWRFEQQLDLDMERERFMEPWDDFYDNEPADEWEECGVCPKGVIDPDDGLCVDCGAHMDAVDENDDMDEPFVMEDQWLDGSYEE